MSRLYHNTNDLLWGITSNIKLKAPQLKVDTQVYVGGSQTGIRVPLGVL